MPKIPDQSRGSSEGLEFTVDGKSFTQDAEGNLVFQPKFIWTPDMVEFQDEKESR